MENNNILICVSGLTPQIISETFYCLTVKNKIKIDELYVLTTQRGRDVIFGLDEGENTPKTPLKKELIALCDKHKIKMPKFENSPEYIIVAKEESIELIDIRTAKQNILFPNKVSEFIREKSSDLNNTLHCSISGGRKSMSVHLAFALSLFGRENDKLYHVLTKEENEFKGFYPQTKKEDKELELAEIPFVRLRSLLSPNISKSDFLKKNFSEIVKLTQDELKVLSDSRKLVLKVSTREIIYGDNVIKLEPLLFGLYYKFVESKVENKKPLNICYLSSPDFGLEFYEFMKQTYEYYYIDEKKKGYWNRGFSSEDLRSKISKVNSLIKSMFNDDVLTNEFIINSLRKYRETSYYLKADASKFKIFY